MILKEDGVWRYYGVTDFWTQKCRRCREKVNSQKTPVSECVDCWKVEVWGKGAFAQNCLAKKGPSEESSSFSAFGLPVLESLVETMYLLGAVPVAKMTVGPIQVVRTGVPPHGYPSEVIDTLLMFYGSSLKEKEQILDSVLKAGHYLKCGWSGDVFEIDSFGHFEEEDRSFIPCRRGCWRYDDLLGPWQDWFPTHKDWECQ